MSRSASRPHDSGFAADWLVVDYRPIEDRQWDAFVTQYCDPEQPATAVNSGPGRRRFEFMRRPDVSVEEITQPEAVWRLMSGWGVTPDNARLERQAVYTFRGRWATAWRRGRVLLAGDAAHLMPPFLGQGLCSGLRDAAALGWLTDEMLGWRGPERLKVGDDRDLRAVGTECTNRNRAVGVSNAHDSYAGGHLTARMTSMLAGRFVRFSTVRRVPSVKCTESLAPRVSSPPSPAMTSSPESTT